MAQYEYGNLYVLRVTIEFGGGGGFGTDLPFDGYLIESQGGGRLSTSAHGARQL